MFSLEANQILFISRGTSYLLGGNYQKFNLAYLSRQGIYRKGLWKCSYWKFHGCNFSRNQRNQTQPSPKSAPEKRLQGLSLWVKHGPLSKLTALDTQYHTLDFVDEFHLTLSLYTTIPLFKPLVRVSERLYMSRPNSRYQAGRESASFQSCQ